MRKIYIDFTKPKDKVLPLFSYAIRFVGDTKYSHVRLRWTNSAGREVIYEASGTQVHFIGTLAQEKHKAEIIKTYELDLTDDEYRKLVDICMKYAGVDYGVLQVIGIALALAFNLKRNPFSDGKYSMVCSELVARVLEEVKGYELKADLDMAGPLEIDECMQDLVMRQLARLSIENLSQ